METQIQISNMIVYISEDGRLFAEVNDKLFELELGTDVTDDIVPELEIIKIFDPEDNEDPTIKDEKLGLLYHNPYVV